jgi:hypothetical protein
MREPVDTAAPWTIKSVATATRDAVNKAAKQEGVTVGQWLDKRVAEWLADGSPVHVAADPAALASLATLADASRAMAESAGIKPTPALAKHMLALTSATARTARGLRPRQPKVLSAPE